MIIIKKEEITKDIIIEVDNNTFLGEQPVINVDNNIFFGRYEGEPIISFINGELKITLKNKVIKPIEKDSKKYIDK